ncbi:MAG: ATP-binding cassette domain-containing protein [Prolixibacteraceae bacterium]
MTKVLTTDKLSKSYGKLQVLKGLSLEVEQGSVFGILGPNGSGKTTTLGILLDVIPQNSGTFQWFGQDPSHKLRKKIGAILETPNFYGYLSAERNLKISALIKEVPFSDIERVLKIVDLFERRKDKFKTFSLGMKQRLAIGAALLGNPEVLVLDEPTNGLDPQGIAEIRKLIQLVASEGITVLLASHMLDEVEKLCSHVAIIKKGTLLVQGKVSELLGDEYILELKSDNMNELYNAIKENINMIEVTLESDKYVVKLSKEVSNGDINQYFFNKGIVLTHFASKKKNLEKQFLEITN